ncbi:drug/metabolite transporter (DMT)-like permease [Stenotrophomonas rhizophila]|uniref:Drug/metabolite transporter (DMT)-like permease n=1 Tax=Stenotrophomonas rhizophila TaxID=216778 RepID=A0AAW5PGU2_9GAMM|nr:MULTISPECIES: drug/metabolite exporter YedA [Stenotrophomonas]MCS4279784.1 drug/metabolite transporter (DMT)-like permease [Stenotrophomonas rhizophila]MCW6029641.1 drug/metabolite exporter YedA [Stenotrophomonas sp. SRS1]ROP73917.1 drug/metabolite transporter (DMT)-like permease [Stenotrophomonas rhizophila]
MAVLPHSPSAAPRSGLVVLALLLVYVVWGSTYLGIRLALEGGALPLTMVSGGRFIIAGSLMYAVLRWRGSPAPTRRQWRNLAIMGLTMLVLGNGMVVLAERTVSSGLAATAVASVPLWMALFGAMRGQNASRGEWLGIAIGFLGVVWLNAGSSLTASPQGLILLLIAPIGWAFGSIWARGLDLPSPFMTAAGQMLCGGVMLVVLGLLSGERPTTWPSMNGLLAVAYLCVFGSIVAFTAYVWLLHNVRPALVASYAYVNPVIAVILGVIIGNEHFGGRDFLAMAVILAGVVVLTLARTRAK